MGQVDVVCALHSYYATSDALGLVHGANIHYYMNMIVLLLITAGLSMLFWVGALARHAYIARQESFKLREEEEHVNVLIDQENTFITDYDQIK